MIAEILATGNELLSGALVDTNSAYISEKLVETGLEITRHTLVGDDAVELGATLTELAARADIIIVTGGLGPTRDDISRDVAARTAEVPLQLDMNSLKKIENFFATRGKGIPKSNHRQAQFPSGAEILENPIGTAPGFSLKINRGTFFFLPGVPVEMRKMLSEQVIPRITKMIKTPFFNRCKTISTYGFGESALEEKLDGFQDCFPGIDLGFRASFPEVQIKLYQKERNQATLMEKQQQALNWIKKRLGQKIISFDGFSLATIVGDLLTRQKATLAIAESCTGGLVANLLTNNAGSSDYFILSAVTYADLAKKKILGVAPEIINEFGAVHEETAKAMANGARKLAGSTYAISTTGIAGPTGGSPEKPVGTICIGLATPSGVTSKRYLFTFGKRKLNKMIFAAQAFDMLRKELLNNK
ncbi:competence/damage-inducible protein A [bacterium]|nr:competence/damage-inducible protein A [bacterium]